MEYKRSLNILAVWVLLFLWSYGKELKDTFLENVVGSGPQTELHIMVDELTQIDSSASFRYKNESFTITFNPTKSTYFIKGDKGTDFTIRNANYCYNITSNKEDQKADFVKAFMNWDLKRNTSL